MCDFETAVKTKCVAGNIWVNIDSYITGNALRHIIKDTDVAEEKCQSGGLALANIGRALAIWLSLRWLLPEIWQIKSKVELGYIIVRSKA